MGSSKTSVCQGGMVRTMHMPLCYTLCYADCLRPVLGRVSLHGRVDIGEQGDRKPTEQTTGGGDLQSGVTEFEDTGASHKNSH